MVNQAEMVGSGPQAVDPFERARALRVTAFERVRAVRAAAADEAMQRERAAWDAFEAADAALWAAFYPDEEDHAEGGGGYMEAGGLDEPYWRIKATDPPAFYARVLALVGAASLSFAEFLEARAEADLARHLAATCDD